MEKISGLKSIVFGANGVIGSEITDLLLNSDYYSSVTVVVRKKLSYWDNLEDKLRSKLTIFIVENLDFLSQSKNEIIEYFQSDLTFDSLFCCIGTKRSSSTSLWNIDYHYCNLIGKFAENFNIPHFTLLSSSEPNMKSLFSYNIVKGFIEYELSRLKLNNMSIFRPPLLSDRKEVSVFSKIYNKVSKKNKLTTTDFCISMIMNDIEVANNQICTEVKIFNYQDQKKILQKD